MELRDYIDAGAKKAGSLTALGKYLNLSQPTMSESRAQRRSLPLDKCVMLADYIGADLREVIAANELATEKKEEKRAFWRPFVTHARMALIVLALGHVTNFVTPNDVQAAPLRQVGAGPICIM